jgi:hypothetical protein
MGVDGVAKKVRFSAAKASKNTANSTIQVQNHEKGFENGLASAMPGSGTRVESFKPERVDDVTLSIAAQQPPDRCSFLPRVFEIQQ